MLGSAKHQMSANLNECKLELENTLLSIINTLTFNYIIVT